MRGGTQHHSRRAGFTLVEVVVAVFLLGIGLAGGYRVITHAMQTRAHAHDYYLATVIANNRIERAKNLAFSEISGQLTERRIRVNELGVPDPQGRFFRSTLVVQNWGFDSKVTGIIVRVEVPHRTRGTRAGGGLVTLSTLLTEEES